MILKLLSPSRKLLTRCFITWMLFIPVAIINGLIREKLFRPKAGELRAHQISVLTACAAFFILAYFMLNRSVRETADKKLLLTGAVWMVMTVLFEFGFGHYAGGASWKRLIQDYNVREGRLWILVLLTLFMTPFLVKKW